MATNRQERMLERMRGAQRHQVEDESFGFILPVAPVATDVPPSSSSASSKTASPSGSSASEGQEDGVDEATPRPRRQGQDQKSIESVNVDSGSGNESEELDSEITPSARRFGEEAELPATRLSDQGSNSRENLDLTPLAPSNAFDVPSSTQVFIAEAIEELTADLSISAVKRPIPRPRVSDPVEDELLEEAASSPIQRLAERVSVRKTAPQRESQLGREQQAGTLPLSAHARARRQVTLSSSPPRGDEVGESPAEAPGSGKRRFVGTGEAARSAYRLRQIMEAGDVETGSTTDDILEHTSPLVAKSRAREITDSARQPERFTRQKTSAPDAEGDIYGLSPPRKQRGRKRKAESGAKPDPRAEESSAGAEDRTERASNEMVETSAPQRTRRAVRQLAAHKEVELDEGDAAEEIDDQEAARRIGRKRPRRSLTGPPEDQEFRNAEDPQPKRRRRNAPASPATQFQTQPKPKGRGKGKKKSTASGNAEEGRLPPVAIAVQRFNKANLGGRENVEHTELLSGDIPHAGRSGVNAVDVLSQLCEDMIARRVGKLRENVENLTSASQRRENTTMRMALEAFQEELKTRFLEHSHALDTAHALQKRIREGQKRKVELREQVMRIRAEKEKVHLRQDALRIRHEAQRREAMRHIAISSSMHDVDLAIEKSRSAPQPTGAQAKEAELANLELLVSQVTDQACSRGNGGGVYKQLKDFNNFLERTAEILERKARQ